MWTLMIIPFALNYHMLRVHPRRLELSMSTTWIRLWTQSYACTYNLCTGDLHLTTCTQPRAKHANT